MIIPGLANGDNGDGSLVSGTKGIGGTAAASFSSQRRAIGSCFVGAFARLVECGVDWQRWGSLCGRGECVCGKYGALCNFPHGLCD